jgi:DNA-binding protein HU-beta
MLNKKQLIDEVCRTVGLTRAEVEKVVEATFQLITSKLAAGEAVRIVSFGTFEVRHRLGRLGRNPHTGERMPIPASKRPAFVPGKELKEAVKGKKKR